MSTEKEIESIQRYNIAGTVYYREWESIPDKAGDWVKFEDYMAALSRAESKLQKQAETIAGLHTYIDEQNAVSRPEAESKLPKQYTLEELRRAYETEFSNETGEDDTWQGWREACRFLGAVKEK